MRGGEHLTRSLVYVDHTLVDGVVNGTRPPWAASPDGCANCRTAMRAVYAVSMFGGAAVLIAATLLMRAV